MGARWHRVSHHRCGYRCIPLQTLLARAFAFFDPDDIEGWIRGAVALLDHDDFHTRFASVAALGHISRRTGHGVPALIDALGHDDSQVRIRVLSDIGFTARRNWPVPGALDAVYAMEDDVDGGVRQQRIQTLTDLKSEDDAWKTIHDALLNDDASVRRGGLHAALVRGSPPEEVAVVIHQRLGDSDPDVRRLAVALTPYIGKGQLKEHVDLLESFFSHDDEQVRRAVIEVLYRISLQP